jgi:hypothetical protein
MSLAIAASGSDRQNGDRRFADRHHVSRVWITLPGFDLESVDVAPGHPPGEKDSDNLDAIGFDVDAELPHPPRRYEPQGSKDKSHYLPATR